MPGRILIILRVDIDPAWREGTTLQVYTNEGSGAVDTGSPLLAKRFEVFPGQPAHKGVGEDPTDLVGVRPGPILPRTAEFGDEVIGVTPLADGVPTIDVPVRVPQDYGSWDFAVEAYDEAGNAQQAALSESSAIVYGTDPNPVRSFALLDYVGGSDQVRFNVTTNSETGA